MKTDYKDKSITDDPEKISKKSSKTKSNIFGKCKICKDQATGIHYGIASCKGCKVSF